jgi:hypothetical protein
MERGLCLASEKPIGEDQLMELTANLAERHADAYYYLVTWGIDVM